MYTISDTWMGEYGKAHYPDWKGLFLILEIDRETILRTNSLPGTVAAYGFTIVLRGRSTLFYSGREITIERNHLFAYMPGFPISVRDVSEDYTCLCLVADESFTVETHLSETLFVQRCFPSSRCINLLWGFPRMKAHDSAP